MALALVRSPEVAAAKAEGRPVVALETSIVAQGFPWPHNRELADAMEAAVRAAGAVPASLAVLDGAVRVGLDGAALDRLARGEGIAKASARDLGALIAGGGSGATTVAASLVLAERAGIEVFATGGIGGVHPLGSGPADISADLVALARTPVVTVSAGAKAILDLPSTLEALDTLGVPVVGFGVDEFPAFYTAESGLRIATRLDTVGQIAAAWRAHRALGLSQAMLVANPPPAETALDHAEVGALTAIAQAEADAEGIGGAALTPFLLAALDRMTGGRTRVANRALAIANADLGARIAVALAAHPA